MTTLNKIHELLNKATDNERKNITVAEGGLSRILAHVKDDNNTFAMISAYRHTNTPKENNRQTMLLTSDLVDMGLGFIKMEGGYIEYPKDSKDSNTDVPVKERSFFVKNITKEQAMELCKKYDQDSVLFKDKDGLRYIDRNGNDVSEVFKDIEVDDNFTLNKIKNYFSRRLQGGNQRNYFRYKESIYVGVQNWRWARHTISEYYNEEKSDKYVSIDTLMKQ